MARTSSSASTSMRARAVLDVVGADAGDLQVVPGGVPERRADEALEGVGVGRGAAGGGRPAPARGQALADAGQVRPRLVARAGASAVPQLAGGLGRGDERALGEVRREPRAADHERAAEARSPGDRRGRVGHGDATSETGSDEAPSVPVGPASPPLAIARASSARGLGRVVGHIGLKLYHCSGAARDRRLEGVGDPLGGPLEVGRSLEDGTVNSPCGLDGVAAVRRGGGSRAGR